MNAKALRIAAQRSARFNLIALMAVVVVFGVLVVKGQNAAPTTIAASTKVEALH